MLRHGRMQKTACDGGLILLLAPPRRLELRSSAPEADTLSTELRGRTNEILSHCIPSHLHLRQVQVLRGGVLPPKQSPRTTGDCFASREAGRSQ